jgi:hypothetical protein
LGVGKETFGQQKWLGQETMPQRRAAVLRGPLPVAAGPPEALHRAPTMVCFQIRATPRG